MRKEEIKDIQTISTYRKRYQNAQKNIIEGLKDESNLTLAGIEKMARVRVSEILSPSQLNQVVDLILDCLSKNEEEADTFLESIQMPAKPTFLEEILSRKDSKNETESEDEEDEEDETSEAI